MIEFRCRRCGKTFYNYPSQERIFCSRECFSISESEKVKKEWATMATEPRKLKLRGLLSLTPEQYKSQAQNGAIKRRGKVAWNKGVPRTEVEKLHISLAVRKATIHQSQSKKAEIRQKQSLALKGKPKSPEHIRKVWNSLLRVNSPFLPWNNTCHRHPNKAERHLGQLLDNLMPNEWRYVGNGRVVIDGKCPDFINVNGKKQIIELFGVYWHKIFDVAERTEHYRQYGYSTLIIWDDELQNKPVLIAKLKRFAKVKVKEYGQVNTMAT